MAWSVRGLLTVVRVGLCVVLLALTSHGQTDPQVDTVCYGDLGCFSNSHGVKVPKDPIFINTEFRLYTRNSSEHPVVLNATHGAVDWLSHLANSTFREQRDMKVVTHGFNDGGDSEWVLETKDELLKKGDFNVFVVHWRHGASAMIDLAASNSFVVAAQLAKFLTALRDRAGVHLNTAHLIGHSLGAHISGNAASKVRGIGRVTGLDPAEPYFIHWDDSRRLDKTDATLVDVIHTDGEPFSLTKGFGLIQQMGDLDFYPNGGVDQAGCTDDLLAGIFGLLTGGNGIQCSHSRAHTYFIESINSPCKFRARPCADWNTYERGICRDCPSDGCPIMGYDADLTSARGSYYLATTSEAPFCGDEYHVQIEFGQAPVHTSGRLNITLLAPDHDSREGEFSRDVETFQPNETASHVIAVNQLVGEVSGVMLRYQKHSGGSNVNIHRIIVEPLGTQTRLEFCGADAQLLHDHPANFTSRAVC